MHHSRIDQLAHHDSPVHRLDARAKLLAVLAYTCVLLTFPSHQPAAMAPMLLGPMAMIYFADVPLGFVARRVALLSPLAIMLAASGLLYDRSSAALAQAAGMGARFLLGLLALIALMASTPLSTLLEAMRRLGMPSMLATQVGLVYRYVFMLIDQAARMNRACQFRSIGSATAPRRLAAVGSLIGSLFIQTLDRSQRVYLSMSVRGFDGRLAGLGRLSFRRSDAAMLACAAAYLALCRLVYVRLLA